MRQLLKCCFDLLALLCCAYSFGFGKVKRGFVPLPSGDVLIPQPAGGIYSTVGYDGTLRLQHPESGSLEVKLAGFGAGPVAESASLPIGRSMSRSDRGEARLSISRPGIVEMLDNTDFGVRQSFSIAAPPAGNPTGGLWVRLSAKGSFSTNAGAARDIEMRSNQGRWLSYTGLRAWDANRKELEATMQYRQNEIVISVNDAGAAYPVTIDPIWGLAQVLNHDQYTLWAFQASGDNLVAGRPEDFFGYGGDRLLTWRRTGREWVRGTTIQDEFTNLITDVSIDGDLVAVGSGRHNQVILYHRAESGWQRTAVITPPSPSDTRLFGYFIDLDGDRLAIAAQRDYAELNVFYIYKLVGGIWTVAQTIEPPRHRTKESWRKIALDGDNLMAGYLAYRFDGTHWRESRYFKDLVWTYLDGDQFVGLGGPTFGRYLKIYQYRKDRWVQILQAPYSPGSNSSLQPFMSGHRILVSDAQAWMFRHTSSGLVTDFVVPWPTRQGWFDDRSILSLGGSFVAYYRPNITLDVPAVIPYGAGTETGTVHLERPAPAGGLKVRIRNSQPRFVQTPWQITVPEGQVQASFPIKSMPHQANGQIAFDIQAANQKTMGWSWANGSLSYSLQIPNIVDGQPVEATMKTYRGSGYYGEAATFHIKNPMPGILQVPETVTFAEGERVKNFTVTGASLAGFRTVPLEVTDQFGLNKQIVEVTVCGPVAKYWHSFDYYSMDTVDLNFRFAKPIPAGGLPIKIVTSRPILFPTTTFTVPDTHDIAKDFVYHVHLPAVATDQPVDLTLFVGLAALKDSIIIGHPRRSPIGWEGRLSLDAGS